jgi:dipeptidyl aminopeptidase/acylaminoacyl peptidase
LKYKSTLVLVALSCAAELTLGAAPRQLSNPETEAISISVEAGTTRQPISVDDLVRFKRFEFIRLSPNEKYVAFVLREPNLQLNVNEMVVYVAGASSDPSARPLLSYRTWAVAGAYAYGVVQLDWMADSETLLLLHQPKGASFPIISSIKVRTGRVKTIFDEPRRINSFASDAAGNRLVITVVAPPSEGADDEQMRRFDSDRGIVIQPTDFLPDPPLQFSKGIIRRGMHLNRAYKGVETELRVVQVGQPSISLGNLDAIQISLSPDGRHLAFSALADTIHLHVPSLWSQHPLWEASLASLWSGGLGRGLVAVLVDLPRDWPTRTRDGADVNTMISRSMRLAFQAPAAYVVGWSVDSRSYVVLGPTPIRDATEVTSPSDLKFADFPFESRFGTVPLWVVDLAKGNVEKLSERSGESRADIRRVVSFDAAAGIARIVSLGGQFTSLRRSRDSPGTLWRIDHEYRLLDQNSQVTSSDGPSNRNDLFSVGASKAALLRQSPTLQPQLFLKDIGSTEAVQIAAINPEIGHRRLAHIDPTSWTKNGTQYSGLIVYPVSYESDRKYPCVIMAKDWNNYSFVLEDQDGYRAGNFPIELAAANGVFVFMAGQPTLAPNRTYDRTISIERFFGARRVLAEKGLVDPTRCAAMGFSSTASELEDVLTRPSGENQFTAGVIVDGDSEDFGFYALLSAKFFRGFLDLKGDPGASNVKDAAGRQAYLLQRSPAWNAANVRTPILSIYHGTTPITGAEFYSALWAMGKPVDFVWFRDESHTLERPWARQANAKLVVDWLKFWLQDVVPQNTREDPTRASRWRELKAQQTQNEAWIAAGKDPTEEFLRTQ